MKILLIRHGMTEGNKKRRYIGTTDEPLCREGRDRLKETAGAYQARRVFVSPMLRCVQTAQILFPDCEQTIVPQLREMDFGAFENRAYEGDLSQDPDYLKWLDTRCEGRVPGGECKQEFTDRCVEGFYEVLSLLQEEPADPAALIVHGGTIMSILSRLADMEGEYYTYNPENGHGYEAGWNGRKLCHIRKI